MENIKNEYLDTAIYAVIESGKILMSNLNKKKQVGYKGKINLVTDVDMKSEKNIVQIIKEKHPLHNIVAEESQPENQNSEYTWYIDPLDGTTNYSHDYPIFAISIALEINNKIQVGVVFDPVRNELFYAVKGKGAYLNKKKISVSKIRQLKRSLLATGFPYIITNRSIKLFNYFLSKAQAIRRAGAAALDLCYLASGRVDGFWELDLKSWDMAAGKIIIKEAGGIITNFKGGEHSLFDDNTLASNGFIHKEMINEIKKADLLSLKRK